MLFQPIKNRIKNISLILSLLMFFTFVSLACSGSDTDNTYSIECKTLELYTANTWYSGVDTNLNALMEAKGKCSANYNPNNMPVAVFDWDNTVIKNDIGDATMFYMIDNNKILYPSAWNIYDNLTTDSITALNTACPIANVGKAITTRNDDGTYSNCGKEIMSIYYNGETTGNDTAFQNDNDTMEPAYAWTVQLEAGYTSEEIAAFAKSAMAENLAASDGSGDDPIVVRTVAGIEVASYIRVYSQIKNLISTLQYNGFDVWISSASSIHIVKALAPLYVGVSSSHVIGIRPILDDDGKITITFEGCGGVADENQSIINYKQGKRCFINKYVSLMGASLDKDKKIVYGNTEAQLITKNTTVLAAGDSNTDIFFVKDALMKLVLDRHKEEIMCNAYNNSGTKNWLITPMFIEPKAKAGGYDCSSYTGLSNVTKADEVDPALYE